MSTFLVLTQFLPKKIIDRGENCILLRYVFNTPIFDTNYMDPYTIRKNVFQATNFSFTPRENLESVWSYKQNKFVAELLSTTVDSTCCAVYVTDSCQKYVLATLQIAALSHLIVD
jgi:hypothetical protein